MTTDTEALICDCPAKNMPFGRCCKLEPLTALRAAFESTVSEWGWDTYRNKAGDYATTSTNGAWAGYQAGHAAAKAETAAAVAGRWYFVTNDGAATLCVDEADARESAAEADIAFPRMAPHLVTQLVSASQLAAAVAAERERCLRIVESVDNYSNPMTANDCAGAIRAGAEEHGE